MFKRIGTHYFAFHLLWLDDADLRPHPLERRKSILQDLLGSRDPVRYCDHVLGSGKAFYEMVREAGLEGMVAKRRRSAYRGGVTGDWLKVKCLRTHEFVVGGWILAHGNASRIAALLLGEFMDGTLHYVGKVDTGFDAKTRHDIGDVLEMRADSPFEESVPEPDAVFCEPNMRVPIEFARFYGDRPVAPPGPQPGCVVLSPVKCGSRDCRTRLGAAGNTVGPIRVKTLPRKAVQPIRRVRIGEVKREIPG